MLIVDQGLPPFENTFCKSLGVFVYLVVSLGEV